MNASLRSIPPSNYPTKVTSPACDPPSTLSPGSAAFIIVALILGTLAQPPGSLVVSSRLGSWRVWRFLPFLCGLEGIVILIALLQAPFSKVSQRRRAFTILAYRTTATQEETRPLFEYLERPKLELILPMMLQIVKVGFIWGSKITTSLAVLYWIDWAMVQYCHCWVWFMPFTREAIHCGHSTSERTKTPFCDEGWIEQVGFEHSMNQLAGYGNLLGTFIFFACNCYMTGVGFWTSGRSLYVLAPLEKDIFLIFIILWLTFGFIGMVFWVKYSFGNFWNRDASKKAEHNRAVFRFAIAVASFFFGIVLYYEILYKETGTFKPPWLDWLG